MGGFNQLQHTRFVIAFVCWNFLTLSSSKTLNRSREQMRRQNAYAADESSVHPRSDVTETENGEWKRGTETGDRHGEQREGQNKKWEKQKKQT